MCCFLYVTFELRYQIFTGLISPEITTSSTHITEEEEEEAQFSTQMHLSSKRTCIQIGRTPLQEHVPPSHHLLTFWTNYLSISGVILATTLSYLFPLPSPPPRTTHVDSEI